jgi:hypothetical protein
MTWIFPSTAAGRQSRALNLHWRQRAPSVGRGIVLESAAAGLMQRTDKADEREDFAPAHGKGEMVLDLPATASWPRRHRRLA